MKALEHTIETLTVGESAQIERTISARDVEAFAAVSGDWSPLHIDDSYAATTTFQRRVVHGMLLGSMASALVGMYLPGKQALLLKLELEFKRPVYIGDTVTLVGSVGQLSRSTGVITVNLTFNRGSDIVAKGNATVKVR